MNPVTTARLAGVWKRELNYEPREMCVDSASRDGSIVYWAQSPRGAFIDVRCIAAEKRVVRGFAGRAEVTLPSPTDPTADPTAFTATWHRHTDTKPDSCPSGVDSATCRVIGDLDDLESSPVLMEEGDGYLEVWRRVLAWDAESCHCTLISDGQEATVEDPKVDRILIDLQRGQVHFWSDATSVGLKGFGVELLSTPLAARTE
jgi:hypothetical protein